MNKGQRALSLKEEGKSNQEIADLLGMSAKSVRRLVSEARSRRDYLEATRENPPSVMWEIPWASVPLPTKKSLANPPSSGEIYTTPKRHFFIPDPQARPDESLEHMRWIGEYAATQEPDVIINAGDHWDMPSLSSYEKAGSRYFEGKRVLADIEAGNRANELFEEGLARRAKPGWSPRRVMLRGNHESVSPDTEILTDCGWVKADGIGYSHKVASFDRTGTISFDLPKAISLNLHASRINLLGDLSDELVSVNHHFVVDDSRTLVEAGTKLNQTRLRYAGQAEMGREIPTLIIRLVTWVVMDGTVVYTKTGNLKRIQFRLALPRKIAALKELLEEGGIAYTEKPGDMSAIGRLPVTVIRIYGDEARAIMAQVGPGKSLPRCFANMTQEGLKVFLEALCQTDGGRRFNHLTWTTINPQDAEIIQLACVFNNIPCKITPMRPNASAFKNGKQQYRVTILDRGTSNRRYVTCLPAQVGPVVSIATVNETLITRRNGKVSFTGNSRLTRMLDDNPALDGVVGFHQFNDVALGWEPYDYQVPVEIDGLTYCHLFYNPGNGRPYSGNVETMIKSIGFSFVQGHQQGLRWGRRELGNGKVQTGLIAGSSYLHEESYRGPQARSEWRGVCVLHEVAEGSYDPMFVSMNYLKRKFG